MNLDIPKIYNDPVLMRKRLGTAIQPFVPIKETVVVVSHRATLTEIPNRFDKVKVTGLKREWHEVEDKLVTKPNQFKVDYTHGVVYFHESVNNVTLTFEYLGEGVYLFPDSRVYHTGNGNFPTLKDKIIDIDRAILVERHRIDEQIMSHPQPSEVVDMRIDYNGKIFRVAKDRIDAEQRKIEEAYVDAKGKRYNSLKERIDSLQLAVDEEVDEIEDKISDIWSEIELVPGKIKLEVGKLEKTVDSEFRLLKSQINLVPSQISMSVKEAKQYTDGKFSQSMSEIKMLSDRIDLKVDVDGVVSSINLSKEGVRLKGDLIHIDGKTKIDDAVIKSAHIDSIHASKIRTGILRSENDNTVWDLNSGKLTMKNTDFDLGGGAKINFSDSRNKIVYRQVDHLSGDEFYVGMGLGRNLLSDNRFPFVYLGTTKNRMLSVNEGTNFTGFIANTGERISEYRAANSVVGDRFHVRDASRHFKYGFGFYLDKKVKVFRGLNTHHEDIHYDIGTYNRRFRNVYTYNIRHNGEVRIRDSREGRRGGWLLQTHYAGNGTNITLRGLNGGTYKYSIGGNTASTRIRNIYLRNKPNVSSDRRLKEDIEVLDLGLDFILDLQPRTFKFKETEADINTGTVNKHEFGFIAQEVGESLEKHGINVKKYSLLNKDEDDYLSLEHEQFIAPIVNSVQELHKRIYALEKEVKRLKEVR